MKTSTIITTLMFIEIVSIKQLMESCKSEGPDYNVNTIPADICWCEGGCGITK